MTFDVPEILDRLGYPITQRGENCVCPTYYRGGDNPNALYVNASGWCHDLVTKEDFHIEKFVSLALSCSLAEAKKFLNSDAAVVVAKKEEKLDIAPKFDTSDIENLTESYKFYLDKGISRETLQTFGAGLAHSGRFYGRIVFPIQSRNCIIGAAARDVLARDAPKWKICGPKRLFLYPLRQAGRHIQERKQVILVESIGDMLRLWEFGIHNVLVLFGTAISSELLLCVLSQNPNEILLGLNNDIEKDINRGQVAADKIRKKFKGFFNEDRIINAPPFQGDFGEATDEELKNWAIKYKVNGKEK